MSEAETHEPTEPAVADVPEPDQDTHEPSEDDADAEAAEAEAEDKPTPDEPEAAAQEQAAQQAEWEARFVKAERAFSTYTRKITEVWADDAVRLVPFMIDPGAPIGFVDTANAGRIPDDVRDSLMLFMGIAREQDYEPDPYASECPTCKGKGFTALPTHVPGNEKRMCPGCQGRGYVGISQSNGKAAEIPAGEDVPALVLGEALSTGPTDMWGEPEILPNGAANPNYGKLPNHKVSVPPWGSTANLTAQDVVTA